MFVSIHIKKGLVRLLNLNAITSVNFIETVDGQLSQQLLDYVPSHLSLPILILETAKEVNVFDGQTAQELYDFITEAMQHTGLLKHAFEFNEKKGECEYHLLPEKTFFDEQ